MIQEKFLDPDQYEFIDEEESSSPVQMTSPADSSDQSSSDQTNILQESTSALSGFGDQPDNKEEGQSSLVSEGKDLLSTVARTPLDIGSGLLSIGSLLEGPEGIWGKASEELKSGSESLGKSLGQTQEVSEKKPLMRAIHYTVGNLPMLALTGGLSKASVAGDVASSLGLVGAEESGAGALGKIGASVLARLGFGKISNILNKKPSVRQDHIKDLYKKEQEIGSKIRVNADPVKKDLDNIYSEVKGSLTSGKFKSSEKQSLLDNISILKDKLSSQDLTASELRSLKADVNTLYNPQSKIANSFNKRILGSFKEELDDIAKIKPEWGKYYKTADNIHSLENWQKGFIDSIKERDLSSLAKSVIKNPLAQSIASALTGVGVGSLGGAGATLGAIGAGASAAWNAGKMGVRELDFMRHLNKTKEGKELLWKMIGSGMKQSASDSIKSLRSLDNMAKKWDANNPQKENNNQTQQKAGSQMSRSLNPDDYEFID